MVDMESGIGYNLGTVKTFVGRSVFITAACAKLTNLIISYTQSARIGLYLTPTVLTDLQEVQFGAGVLRLWGGSMAIHHNGEVFTYEEYLKTDHWQAKRKEALAFWEYRCSLCYAPGSLHVHHRNYHGMFAEQMNDLIVFCDDCHKRHHGVLEINEKLKYFWEGVYQELQAEGLLEFWNNEENVDKN